jgi:arginine deiminase
MRNQLLELPIIDLAGQLIEGVPLTKNTLTSFLNPERYALQPLHNFFFTRDTAFVVNETVFISRLSTEVREREALIMDIIFNHHPKFTARTVNPLHSKLQENTFLEGGDFLVVRDDVMIVGIGSRTNSKGVDYIIEHLNDDKKFKHIIVQQIPLSPESFIHLDMVFTMLDVDAFMIYEPVILNQHDFQTIHIELESGRIDKIREQKNIPEVLRSIGITGEFIPCGGDKDTWSQEREQWHSGANFFAIGPGKVLGYRRNVHTLSALAKHGFSIISAHDMISGKDHPQHHKRCVVTIEGSELARGGGGCRCMTLPLSRESTQI